VVGARWSELAAAVGFVVVGLVLGQDAAQVPFAERARRARRSGRSAICWPHACWLPRLVFAPQAPGSRLHESHRARRTTVQPAQLSLLPEQVPAPAPMGFARLPSQEVTTAIRLLARLIARSAGPALAGRPGRPPAACDTAARQAHPGCGPSSTCLPVRFRRPGPIRCSTRVPESDVLSGVCETTERDSGRPPRTRRGAWANNRVREPPAEGCEW
jgi:hypothetical protein